MKNRKRLFVSKGDVMKFQVKSSQVKSSNVLDFPVSAKTLIKYAMPTMLSSLFMNIYGLVDAFFVANWVGTDGLSAVNIVMPFLAVALAVAAMVATGGSALVAKQLGEGKEREAKENFSFFLLFCVAVSTILCLVGMLNRSPVLRMMGADDALYPLCEAYAIPLFASMPAAMCGAVFQMFFVVAGRPDLSFGLSILGGVLNMIPDYVLLAVFPLGIAGAAIATGLGYAVQGVAGLFWFTFRRKDILCLVRPKWNGKALLKACGNGMSEMVGMLAGSVTMVSLNVIMMGIAGSNGVAAAAIVLFAQTVLSAVYMGFLEGIAPVISYKYGKGDTDNLKRLYKASLKIIGVMSVVTFLLTFPLAKPIALLFGNGVEDVINMAVYGTKIFCIAFLLMGFNMFASSIFTAFNDGKTPAILALFRTLIFLIIPLLILPSLLGIDGVWLALPTAEVFSAIMSVYYFKTKKAVYHYA